MDSIEQTLCAFIQTAFIVERGSGDRTLSPDDPLVASGVVDSLGIFEVIAFVEEQFSVNVLPEDVVIDNFETVHAIGNLVHSRLVSRQRDAA